MVIGATEPGGDGKVDHETLEQVAGILNHVARTFPTITIYLNSVYATMNSWHPDRDKEGWRVGDYKVECETQSSAAPKRVQMVKHMTFDVKALEDLTPVRDTAGANVVTMQVRSESMLHLPRRIRLRLGTSELGLGEMEVQVDYGSWGVGFAKGTSSNFQELANIVFKIDQMDLQGALTELMEVFIFTDNYHTESAFYCGTAKSPKVLELMHLLHKILMRG
ncbi:hypothetical protein ACA910_011214 [Epithemia clementina (nom. ined.)]